MTEYFPKGPFLLLFMPLTIACCIPQQLSHGWNWQAHVFLINDSYYTIFPLIYSDVWKDLREIMVCLSLRLTLLEKFTCSSLIDLSVLLYQRSSRVRDLFKSPSRHIELAVHGTNQIQASQSPCPPFIFSWSLLWASSHVFEWRDHGYFHGPAAVVPQRDLKWLPACFLWLEIQMWAAFSLDMETILFLVYFIHSAWRRLESN